MGNTHVFHAEQREDGSLLSTAASINAGGCLVIEIHDMGPVVERAFGMSEYESVETFDREQTARLREALGEDLIAAIGERFPTSSLELSEFAVSIGVGRGKVWNRIGD